MRRSEVTAWLVERARRFAESGAVPAPPRLASTVALLRPGPEVFLLRRASTMAFAAGMYAFPGGSVSGGDSDARVGWVGPAPAWWAARLRVAEPVARALVCAAVREVFEETGVLLAGPDAQTAVGDVTGPAWERDRLALIAGETTLAELLSARELVVRADLLAPWSRWVTPEFEPRRFDTYFFVAAVPAGQRTREVGGEADATIWARPADALAGEYLMLPPTTATLAELGAYQDVAAVFAGALERDPAAAVRPTVADLLGQATDDG